MTEARQSDATPFQVVGGAQSEKKSQQRLFIVSHPAPPVGQLGASPEPFVRRGIRLVQPGEKLQCQASRSKFPPSRDHSLTQAALLAGNAVAGMLRRAVNGH